MAIFLLDTSIIIDTLNDKKNRRVLLRRLVEAGNTLACCAINVAEIYAGVRPQEEAATDRFLGSLEYYPIHYAAARMAGGLKQGFRKKGVTLTVADTLIAAVAIQESLTLITDNIKDFPMAELTLHPLPQ